VIIRRCTAADDLTPAVELLVRFFREEGFECDPERIACHAGILARLETCGLFVAEDDDRCIGVASGSLEFGIEYGWWAEMGDLYVVPEWRRRGTSRTLVQAVEAFLRERGVAGYQVTVTPHGSEARGLGRYYERLGFASEGRMILRKLL
jgi:GNAT superfamily N-acetyltransferase